MKVFIQAITGVVLTLVLFQSYAQQEPEIVAPKTSTDYKIFSLSPNVSKYIGQEYFNAETYCTTEFSGKYGNGSFTHISNLIESADGGVKSSSGLCHFDNQANLQVAINGAPETNATCPPEQYPEHVTPVDQNNDGEIDGCKKRFKECDIGFFKYAVADSSGTEQCVPIDCPNAGTAQDIFASTTHYDNTSGTMCDGKCAYQVDGGQNPDGINSSVLGVQGVATGDVCGQGSKDDAFFIKANDTDKCNQVMTDTGKNFLSCGENEKVTEEDKPIDPLDVDDLKESPNDIPENPDEPCVINGQPCEIKDLIKQNQNDTKEIKEQQQNQHNKEIEAIKKANDKLAQTMSDLQKINSAALGQISKSITTTNKILENGVGAGGVGGGANIPTDGAGVGAGDLGDAVGDLDYRVPNEVVQLENYTSQYSGWLPDVPECPTSTSYSFNINGATQSIDFNNAPLCQMFNLLGYLLMASAYMSVAFMIHRSL